MTYTMVVVFLKETFLVCRTSLVTMMKTKWRKLMRKSVYHRKSWSSYRKHWKLKMQVNSQQRSFKQIVLTLHSTIFVSSSSSLSLREECCVNKEKLLRRLMPLGLNDRLKQRSIILIQQQRNLPERRQTCWWSTSMTKTFHPEKRELVLKRGSWKKIAGQEHNNDKMIERSPFKKVEKEKINLYSALFLD